MYLENIKNMETKKGFIAQILTISEIYYKTKGSYVGISRFFSSFSGIGNKDICSIFLKNSINELSNNDKEVEYELNEIQGSFNNYIQHIKESNNDTNSKNINQVNSLLNSFVPSNIMKGVNDFIEETNKTNEEKHSDMLNMFEKIWQKYSKHIENEEIKIKKSIYFELYAFVITLDVNLDFYFKLIKNKLNLSENIYKEIENIIQCNASIYKSISDIINIG